MSKVIAIDLELNQPSGKIIELGYTIGDVVSGKIFSKQAHIINPEEPLGIIPGLNVHITDYTGITQELIDLAGTTLPYAYKQMCEDIKKYNPTVTVVQWGQGDSDCLREQLGLSWDDYVFRQRIWDAKSLYQIHRCFQREGVAAGLEKAMKTLGMEFEGRPHRAIDDAYNTFRIFRELGLKSINYDKIKGIIK